MGNPGDAQETGGICRRAFLRSEEIWRSGQWSGGRPCGSEWHKEAKLTVLSTASLLMDWGSAVPALRRCGISNGAGFAATPRHSVTAPFRTATIDLLSNNTKSARPERLLKNSWHCHSAPVSWAKSPGSSFFSCAREMKRSFAALRMTALGRFSATSEAACAPPMPRNALRARKAARLEAEPCATSSFAHPYAPRLPPACRTCICFRIGA